MSMNVQQVSELLLQRMNSIRSTNNAFFGATDGTIGNINVLQKDMNQALTDWHERKDASGLKRMATLLQAMGNMNDAEYEQIMQALDSNK